MLPSDVLLRDGWIKGRLGSGNEGRCILGAMQEVFAFEGGTYASEYWEIREAVRAIIHEEVANWNDQHCPSFSVAVAVLRQAEINCGFRNIVVDPELVEVPYLAVVNG